MLRDVTFNDGEKSAYYDWNIVLTKTEIPLPKVKVTTVDIMGADGVLDLSEALTGDVKYENRVAKLTFEVLDDSRFVELLSEISNHLHGKMVTFSLSDDDEYYYTGRASINSWECSRRKGKIVITVDCEPYKLEVEDTVITIPITNTPTYYALPNLRKQVCPIIDVRDSATVAFDGVTYNLTSGVQQVVAIQFVEGDNWVLVSGSGSASASSGSENARLGVAVLGKMKMGGGSGTGGSGTITFTYKRGAL